MTTTTWCCWSQSYLHAAMLPTMVTLSENSLCRKLWARSLFSFSAGMFFTTSSPLALWPFPTQLHSFSRKRNQEQQKTNIPREWKYLQCLILQSSAVPVQWELSQCCRDGSFIHDSQHYCGSVAHSTQPWHTLDHNLGGNLQNYHFS